MADLLDISDTVETVRIGNKDIAVPGVSMEGVVSLALRFPLIISFFVGSDEKQIDIKEIIGLGPKVAAAIIAAGCGYVGDEQREAVAAKLAVGHQMKLLMAIKKVTELDTFLSALSEIKGVKSPSEVGSKARLKSSPKPSNSSSHQDTSPAASGP